MTSAGVRWSSSSKRRWATSCKSGTSFVEPRGLLADPLGSRSAGGVKLVSGTRRITVNNTLDERLQLLEDRVRYAAVDGYYGCLTFLA